VNLPASWSEVTLAELCRAKPNNGIFRKNPEYLNGASGGMPVVWVGELFKGTSIDVTKSRRVVPSANEVDKYGLKFGDLLFCRSSLKLDGIAFNNVYTGEDDKALFECHLIRVSPDLKRASPPFLNWLLRSPRIRAQLKLNSKTATMTTIDQAGLCKIKIPLPPLSEQKRIAEILDRAEALRAKRRAALALLDELTQSIFLDMFGDPVTNPKGWELRTLGDSLTFQLYGPRFYNEKYTDDGTRIVRITDLDSQGNLDFASMPRLEVCEEDREKYCLKSGDILFARTGATVGKVALMQAGAPECIAGAYFIVMRFKAQLNPMFVRSVLTTKSIQAIVWIRSQQSAQQNFSGPGLRALPLPLPPTEMQKLFARRIAGVELLKEPHRVSLAELDQLFASLQHRAFRGEL